jgi:hypothetical protein
MEIDSGWSAMVIACAGSLSAPQKTPIAEFGQDDAAEVSAFHQLRAGLSL